MTLTATFIKHSGKPAGDKHRDAKTCLLVNKGGKCLRMNYRLADKITVFWGKVSSAEWLLLSSLGEAGWPASKESVAEFLLRLHFHSPTGTNFRHQ